MIYEGFKRTSFKEILDILEPDLGCEFKVTSYFHNDYKRKSAKRKPSQSLSEPASVKTRIDSTKECETINKDPDNYL